MNSRDGRNSITWQERWLNDLDVAARGGASAGVWFVTCFGIIGSAGLLVTGFVLALRWAFL